MSLSCQSSDCVCVCVCVCIVCIVCMYRSVPQSPPPPCIFSAKSCRGIFIPPPLLKLLQSGSRSLWWNGSARTKPASTELLNISRSLASLFMSLGSLLLNCLPRTRTPCSNDGHTNYFAEAPCFLGPQR